mmetsp:Transcript_15188/g.38590  ORF Transcript_15188/g.38590 Transcript_15188/m.38590 type:complete len:327 (-) Transcript_15188:89-1069(-)
MREGGGADGRSNVISVGSSSGQLVSLITGTLAVWMGLQLPTHGSLRSSDASMWMGDSDGHATRSKPATTKSRSLEGMHMPVAYEPYTSTLACGHRRVTTLCTLVMMVSARRQWRVRMMLHMNTTHSVISRCRRRWRCASGLSSGASPARSSPAPSPQSLCQSVSSRSLSRCVLLAGSYSCGCENPRARLGALCAAPSSSGRWGSSRPLAGGRGACPTVAAAAAAAACPMVLLPLCVAWGCAWGWEDAGARVCPTGRGCDGDGAGRAVCAAASAAAAVAEPPKNPSRRRTHTDVAFCTRASVLGLEGEAGGDASMAADGGGACAAAA